MKDVKTTKARRQKSELRVLLLQIREHSRVRREEHQSFCSYAGLEPRQLSILNVFDTPEFGPNDVKGYDALFVGGSSAASVLEPERFPFIRSAMNLLRHCLDRDIPVFASCFGFQLAVLELGGTITTDQVDFEMGTPSIHLTPAAREDPIFRDLRGSFFGVSVHQESALECPSGCIELAYTDMCCHAYRIAGKRFWAFQFHPEVDKKTLVERLTIYKNRYTEHDDHLQEILQELEDTDESNNLVANFIERVVLD